MEGRQPTATQGRTTFSRPLHTPAIQCRRDCKDGCNVVNEERFIASFWFHYLFSFLQLRVWARFVFTRAVRERRDGQFLLATTLFFFSFALPIVFAHSKPYTHTHTHTERLLQPVGRIPDAFLSRSAAPSQGKVFQYPLCWGGWVFCLLFSNQPRLLLVCDFLTPPFPSCHGWHVTRVDLGGIVSHRTGVEGGNV